MLTFRRLGEVCGWKIIGQPRELQRNLWKAILQCAFRNFVLEIQGRLVTEGARVASGLEVTLEEFGELAIKSCRMRG